MPDVRYTGSSHYREISATDWKSVGVEGQGKVVFDRDNRGGDGHSAAKQICTLTDQAWAYLQEHGDGEFELVESAEAGPADDTAGAPPDVLSPGGLPAAGGLTRAPGAATGGRRTP